MTPMVSASAKASSWSWVTSTVVMPSSRCTARMVRRSSSRIFGVQGAEGLVEQEHLRLVRQRARHGDSLLLTARKLARQPLVHAFERHQLEQFLAPGSPIGGLHPAHAQREFDVVRDRHVAEQRVVLEHQADAAIARTHVGDVAAVQGNAPVVDAREAGNGPKQGALAAARGAQQHEEFALAHLDGNVVDDGLVLIPFGDLVECDRHAVGGGLKTGGDAISRWVLARITHWLQCGDKRL